MAPSLFFPAFIWVACIGIRESSKGFPGSARAFSKVKTWTQSPKELRACNFKKIIKYEHLYLNLP